MSCKVLPALNLATLRAGTFTVSRVRGLIAVVAALLEVANVPKPTKRTSSPDFKAAETEESEESTEGNAGETAGETYKIGLVQFVDDASLNQIREAVIAELKAKEADCGVTFEILESNGQADSTVLNQIATDLIEDKVDMIIPIARIICNMATT